MHYHVFISYRRDGGDAMARLLYDRLQADGYCPFLDVEQMRSGKFNDQLLKRIAECDDFVLILPPNGLDRCRNEEDWVRKEIVEALRLGKNIIPFMLRGFSFPTNLPECIKEVKDYQGIPASQDYFDSTMERLKSLLSYHPQQFVAMEDAPQKTTIQIGNKIYEVDEGVTRQDIIEMNKARRVETGKQVLLGLLILTAVAAVTYGLNLLVRNYINQVLDSWLYANSENSVASLEVYHPTLLLFFAAVAFLPCAYLFSKGLEIESITLKILAVILYLLIVLVMHLLPGFLLMVGAIVVALFILKTMFLG